MTPILKHSFVICIVSDRENAHPGHSVHHRNNASFLKEWRSCNLRRSKQNRACLCRQSELNETEYWQNCARMASFFSWAMTNISLFASITFDIRPNSISISSLWPERIHFLIADPLDRLSDVRLNTVFNRTQLYHIQILFNLGSNRFIGSADRL